MSGEFVSVVIPTYNRARQVLGAIDSVLNQSHQDVEVIVIDDGSTDGTDAAIQRKYGNDKRVHYSYQENAGVSAARNRGLHQARGDYITFLDSDDEWKPFKLELQLKCMRFLPEAVMCWTDMEAVDSLGNTQQSRYLRTMYPAYDQLPDGQLFDENYELENIAPEFGDLVKGGSLSYGSLYPKIIVANFVHTPTVLIRSDCFKTVPEFDEELAVSGEDHDFHIRTCREGPVALIDVPSIKYQVGGEDQLTHASKHSFMATNYLRTMDKALKQDPIPEGLSREAIKNAHANAYGWLGTSLLDQGKMAQARSNLWKSLMLRPAHTKRWAFLFFACLPVALQKAVYKTYVFLKSRYKKILNK